MMSGNTVFFTCVLVTLVHLSTQQVERLKENDQCMNKNGQAGICKSLSSCPQGLTAIQSGARPKTCGFNGDTLIICCPTESKSPPAGTEKPKEDRKEDNSAAIRIAKQKCEEYGKTIIVKYRTPLLVTGADGYETIDTCGRREEPLVVGGENAKSKEFPHMALIGYGEEDPEWLCGGSLISKNFVLSAAHCSRPAIGLATWVKLGDLDTSTTWDNADPHVLKIIQRFVHPLYKRDKLYNDIALFKLEEDVEITGYIRPLCLFTEREIPQKVVIASGWGHTSWGGTASASLMKVKLDLVTNKYCNQRYESSIGPKLAEGILESSQLCAGDTAGKDTCQGDSGGPLQIPLKEPYCMYGLVGVTSFGKSCGTGYPGVYSRVYHYLPWIVKIVWPEE